MLSPRYHYRQQMLRWMSVSLAVVVVLASISGLALWRLQTVTVLSVQSDSMAPLIHKGDAVLVYAQTPASIREGDIVSYPNPASPQETVTHRVVYVDPVNYRMVTKGDANVSVDPVADASVAIGSVSSVIPKAGVLIDMLHSWHGLTALVYIPAALILAQEMVRVVRYYSRPTYRLLKPGH